MVNLKKALYKGTTQWRDQTNDSSLSWQKDFTALDGLLYVSLISFVPAVKLKWADGIRKKCWWKWSTSSSWWLYLFFCQLTDHFWIRVRLTTVGTLVLAWWIKTVVVMWWNYVHILEYIRLWMLYGHPVVSAPPCVLSPLAVSMLRNTCLSKVTLLQPPTYLRSL